MFDNPDYVRPEFGLVSLGYLRAPAHRLPDVLQRLPAPRSQREQAIVSAIRWGVRCADEWDRAIQPLRLERRPNFSVRVF